MAVTEKQRHDLFNKLEETLGSDGVATLMDMLPPVGWADVATKHDIAALRQATKQDIERLERRIDSLGDVFATKAELHQELRGQTRTFVGWMVTSQATLAAVVAMIVSLG
jgi:hypothetical protein